MRKYSSLVCFSLATLIAFVLPLAALAQANPASQLPNGKKADYSFTSDALPGTVAQFVNKDSVVYYSPQGKKPLPVSFPKGTTLKQSLAWAAINKKLKPSDILFLQAALAAWDSAKVNIGFTLLPDGLAYKIDQEGTGKLPEKGHRVTVHYRGYLQNGKVFDSSYPRNQPLDFILGNGQVIKGWDEGIPLFKVGSKGTLRIPPKLGYGDRGAGDVIPPNATLFFDIELVNAD